MPHQLRLQGANALIVIPGRAPVCLRCKRTGHIRRECRVPKCSECYRFGHEKDECVKTYARVTDGAAADAASQEIMDADEAESASRGLEPEAPSPAEERRRPARPVTAAHVPRSNVENELAGDVAQPEVAVSPPAATVPEVRAATRDGCSPPSEETSPEGLTAMDETTESVKRALDESSSRAGMTPKLNPWMERTKKGRYQLTSDVPQDERTRRDSKGLSWNVKEFGAGPFQGPIRSFSFGAHKDGREFQCPGAPPTTEPNKGQGVFAVMFVSNNSATFVPRVRVPPRSPSLNMLTSHQQARMNMVRRHFCAATIVVKSELKKPSVDER
ncbi:hypothetical protein HPB47_011989 [Ixodes persulcatus]|uniref:Uncharacterized protein n=1 Tax=Ixodes persulcatus TaxID=34615 RepID=A0AC60NUW3_IXOPE|nr:hypothetical protein HPB47_011989 [Ixodes persulcatus]